MRGDDLFDSGREAATEKHRQEVLAALGYPPGTTTTWKNVLKMVEHIRRQVVAVREVVK